MKNILKLEINHFGIIWLSGSVRVEEKLISLNQYQSVGIHTRQKLVWALKICFE